MSQSREIAVRRRRVLHQFPRSHYCEKVRWHLDLKGLEYEVRNLFPGTHARVNRRLGGGATVPLLIDGDRMVHDSRAIALYLEQTYPGPCLIPEDESLRALVLAMQAYFDGAVGPAVRHWLYGHLLRKRGRATASFFRDYSRGMRLTGRLLSRLFERQLGKLYPRDDASLARVETAILDGAERLENTLEKDPDRFLVGGVLSLADVTAASLLAPLIGPAGSPWEDSADLSPAVIAMREHLRGRVAGQWVLRRYAHDRPLGKRQSSAANPSLAKANATAPPDGAAASGLSPT